MTCGSNLTKDRPVIQQPTTRNTNNNDNQSIPETQQEDVLSKDTDKIRSTLPEIPNIASEPHASLIQQLETNVRAIENELQKAVWHGRPEKIQRNFIKTLEHELDVPTIQKLTKFWNQFENYIFNRPAPDYSKGLVALINLYNETPNHPNSIIPFNIAVCYHHTGDIWNALHFLTPVFQKDKTSDEVLREMMAISFSLRFFRFFMDAFRHYYDRNKNTDSHSHALIKFELRFGYYKNAIHLIQELNAIPTYKTKDILKDYLVMIAWKNLKKEEIENQLIHSGRIQNSIIELTQFLEPLVNNMETAEFLESFAKEEEEKQNIKAFFNAKQSTKLTQQRDQYLKELSPPYMSCMIHTIR